MTKSKTIVTNDDPQPNNSNVIAQPKKFAVKTPYNYRYVPAISKEENTGVSSTVPGQAPSLNTLLQRAQQGLPIEQRVPIYDTVGHLVDLRTLDLVDRQKLAERMNTEFTQKKKEFDEAKQRKSEADKAARLKEKEDLYNEFKTRFSQEQQTTKP